MFRTALSAWNTTTNFRIATNLQANALKDLVGMHEGWNETKYPTPVAMSMDQTKVDTVFKSNYQ
jgi:hypothetical protein